MAEENANPTPPVEVVQASSLSGCAQQDQPTIEGGMPHETGKMPVLLPVDEPLSSAPRTDRADKLAFALATLVALLVYLFTLAPEVTLEDSGVLVTSAFYGGVAGPPGQPVWTLYSRVFTKILPFSNPAWRVAVGSAVAGALLCGFVAMIISFSANAIFKDAKLLEKLTRPDWDKLRIGGGVAASLVLGFNGPFWYEALVADIWSLSFLLFAIVLWLLLRVSFYSGGRGALCLAFLLFGLLLTNSQELLVALPGFVCLLMFNRARLGRDLAMFFLPLAAILTAANSWNANPPLFTDHPWNWPMTAAFVAVVLIGCFAAIVTEGLGTHWKSALAAACGLIGGFAFYLYLPMASMTTPPVNWGYPRTVEGFLHVLARGQYEKICPTNSAGRYAEQLWHFFWNTGEDFGWLYLCIGVLGGWFLWGSNLRGRRWLLGLVAVWICTGPLMLAMLNPSDDRQSRELVAIFCDASHIILTVLLGIGLICVGAWLTRSSKQT